MSIQIQNAVNEVLRLNNIAFNAVYVDQVKKEGNWNCDYFVCTLKYKGTTETFNYHTGLGLRKNNKTVMPKATDVLYSLFLDCTQGEDFIDWCANYGYDSDSIKAMKIYEACQANETKLKNVLPNEVFKQLQIELQDY